MHYMQVCNKSVRLCIYLVWQNGNDACYADNLAMFRWACEISFPFYKAVSISNYV